MGIDRSLDISAKFHKNMAGSDESKRAPGSSELLLLTVLLILSILQTTTAFSIPTTTRRCQRTPTTTLYSIFDDEDKEETPMDGVDFAKFNPLSYKSSRSNSAHSYSGTQISLRKTTMTELTNEMLNAVGDDEAMQTILEDYRDFLLEPLDDLEAVLVRNLFVLGNVRVERIAVPQDGRFFLFSVILGSRLDIHTANVPWKPISSLSGFHGGTVGVLQERASLCRLAGNERICDE
jgi:hypothetical protein